VSKKLEHITWCLSGPLSLLPLHAAGVYIDNTPGSKLTDFAVSSYIPSLTTLSHCQQPRILTEAKLLSVALPLESGLPESNNELLAIQNILDSITITQLLEKDTTKTNVMKGMKECSFVHFACHGEQDSENPTQSGLLLADGIKLTLNDIIKLKLPHAQLAFLSACQTATGDRTLPEEATHLAAGMLISGYQGVIATMWSIHDETAPIVTEEFYKELWKDDKLDVRQAAYALYKAIDRLQREGKSFLEWVPFIHMGV